MVHEIEKFFGVYLLYCINPKYKGRTYIGFTVNPNRRIGQHNKGHHAGGAMRTSGRGPWDMVLIVHGFPNHVSALRFEWAWQNPKKSRRLKHLPVKRKNENQYTYRLRIVSHMLRTGPWDRLPLTIRWLKQDYQRDFDPDLTPPLHMAIAYGPVETVNSGIKETPAKSQGSGNRDDDDLPNIATKSCAVCIRRLKDADTTLRCLHPTCCMEAHITCLAQRFCPDHVLPIEGDCPSCGRCLLWGDLVRYKRGCYQNLKMGEDSGEDS